MSKPCMAKDDLVRWGMRIAEELTDAEGPGLPCTRTELARWGRLAVDLFRSEGPSVAKRFLKAGPGSPFGRGRGRDYTGKVKRVIHVLCGCIDEVDSRCGHGESAANEKAVDILERIIGYAAREMRYRDLVGKERGWKSRGSPRRGRFR